MSSFWDKLKQGSSTSSYVTAMDQHLQGSTFVSMQELTDTYRQKSALHLPVEAGTRVAFMGWLESYLSYTDPPQDKDMGTVVTAKSANGESTSFEDLVFVKFDNGKLLSVHTSHLRLVETDTQVIKQASFTVKSFSDLDRFLVLSTDHLVHKCTQDLWSFKKDADGNITVEKLYDDNGNPLKV